MPATISGTAFLDGNGNGLPDPGEGAVADVVVTATQSATNSTATTDDAEHYNITGLTYGPWHITIAAPAGYFVGTPADGTASYYFSNFDTDAAQLDIGLAAGPAFAPVTHRSRADERLVSFLTAPGPVPPPGQTGFPDLLPLGAL